MSLTLAIDTATALGSVALGEPGRLVADIRFSERRHAAALVPAIEQVLRIAGADYDALHRLIVADGPGSFTGIRIGVATAKGILQARPALPLATTPSMLGAAFAASAFHAGSVAVMYDALRGDVFAAVYTFGPCSVQTELAPVRTIPEALPGRCAVAPSVAVGDGAVAYADLVRRWTGRDPVGPPEGGASAAALLELLALPGAVQEVREPDAFEPVYGRLAEAQARWERTHGRPLPDPGGHEH